MPKELVVEVVVVVAAVVGVDQVVLHRTNEESQYLNNYQGVEEKEGGETLY